MAKNKIIQEKKEKIMISQSQGLFIFLITGPVNGDVDETYNGNETPQDKQEQKWQN